MQRQSQRLLLFRIALNRVYHRASGRAWTKAIEAFNRSDLIFCVTKGAFVTRWAGGWWNVQRAVWKSPHDFKLACSDFVREPKILSGTASAVEWFLSRVKWKLRHVGVSCMGKGGECWGKCQFESFMTNQRWFLIMSWRNGIIGWHHWWIFPKNQNKSKKFVRK